MLDPVAMRGVITTRHLVTHAATIVREFGLRRYLRCLTRAIFGPPCTFLELAWFAADGRRTLAELAGVVALETGGCNTSDVARFFDLAARMGLAEWRDGEA